MKPFKVNLIFLCTMNKVIFGVVLFFWCVIFSSATNIYTSHTSNLKNIIIENLNNTKHNVTGLLYKFDDKDVFDVMKRVGQNGVQYDLICDENAYDMASELSDWGNISLFKNVGWYDKLHAKAMMFDDLVLLVGSFNLDKTTFSTNMEIIVEITSNSYINVFKNRFNEIKLLL